MYLKMDELFNIKFESKYKKQQVSFLPAGVDSMYIVELQNFLNSQLLYVASDVYIANRIASEVSFFANKKRIVVLPDYEVLPYEHISASVDLIAQRLKALWQIIHNQADIIIVAATTLQARLCPIDYLLSKVLLLKISDKMDVTKLKEQLVCAGYSLVTQVYESGEFAVRGGVIDILPMGSKNVIRIDLFDDEIESIALIDPKSRNIIKNVDKFELVPTCEYPTDLPSLQLVSQKILDKFPKELDFVKDIAKCIIPAGFSALMPLFFDNVASLFDYLDKNCHIVYADDLESNLALNWQDITKRYELFKRQSPCLSPIDVFIPSDQIFANINRFKATVLGTSGKMFDGVKLITNVTVDNQLENPCINLQKFINLFNGKVVICVNSLGRSEILLQTLATYNIDAKYVRSISDIDFATNFCKVYMVVGPLYHGFIVNNVAFVTEDDLYQKSDTNIRIIKRKSPNVLINDDLLMRDLAEIKTGDFVVHVNHGIGKYLGLTTREIEGNIFELIELEYQNGSKLFIPVSNLHLISRYSSIEGTNVELSVLGAKKWDNLRKKAEQKVNDVAVELLELYASREMQKGDCYSLPDEYKVFSHAFGFEPTSDQSRAFDEIINDMTNVKPMDRLVCGDVGFGKTEVAMRAAFICAMNGYQVAVLAPTTLLVEQHYQNFVNRFVGMPIKIAEISRFRSKKEIENTLKLSTNGDIDILIGTHRLLQDDIKFANLGLVIIDEEHRFGVKQKEKLKQLRINVNFLAMTATPIPRSLSMALDGLRDFTIIATPPSRRLAVNTIVCGDDDTLIKEAILREVRRGGQVFFLYNDVASIEIMQSRLLKLLPELKIAIAHGQMSGVILEQTIRDFIRQKYNILLCSTIIETGIDIPNANTIVIYRADKFGLAQLHQLRGRVGRSHHQAYCYLITPENATKDAEKRLDAIQMTKDLGGGFNLALHDLEIRGAGEILGESQSGDIKHLGLSLYTEMLKKAISRLKNGESLSDLKSIDGYCEVNLSATSLLPDDYCIDVHERLIFYKRLARADNLHGVDLVYQDIIDTCGLPPQEVKTLVNIHYIRIKAQKIGVVKLDVTTNSIILKFIENPPIDPHRIVTVIQKLRTCKYDGFSKLIWQIKSEDVLKKISNVNYLLHELGA